MAEEEVNDKAVRTQSYFTGKPVTPTPHAWGHRGFAQCPVNCGKRR